MSGAAEQYPYVETRSALGATNRMPYLPFTLSSGVHNVAVSGLLDSGAAINAMPHAIGLQLGASWDAQTTPLRLTGNLSGVEARALIVTAVVGTFAPVRLAFAWARIDDIPLILGQMNFFVEFDVCFFRTRERFEVRPKQGGQS
jgi:hypothetical protein